MFVRLSVWEVWFWCSGWIGWGVRRCVGELEWRGSWVLYWVLRWFGHVEWMDEYCMAKGVDGRCMRRVGMGLTKVWLDGSYEDALRLQRGKTVDAALKLLRSGEPWCICWWVRLTRPYCLALHSFGLPSHALSDWHLEKGGILLHDEVGIICKKGTTTEN